ncbi:hypothetical protein [Nostoc sp. CHAB 5715]|nr:hypothetical protein [Nostoc sp. CHAB 5715]
MGIGDWGLGIRKIVYQFPVLIPYSPVPSPQPPFPTLVTIP